MNLRSFPIVFLLFSTFALAKDIPKPPLNYILDEPKALSESATLELSQKLQNFEEKTSNQMVIAIFNSLDNENLADYANRVFRAWKIGEKTKNNGILIALAYKERQIRIEVGYGLEPVITDAFSKDVILTQLTPSLKDGRPDLALNQAVDRLMERVVSPSSDLNNKPKAVAQENQVNLFFVVLGILLFIGLMVGLHFMGVPIWWIFRIVFDVIAAFSGGGGKDDGFSGGGGSSGGGGASGDY